MNIYSKNLPIAIIGDRRKPYRCVSNVKPTHLTPHIVLINAVYEKLKIVHAQAARLPLQTDQLQTSARCTTEPHGCFMKCKFSRLSISIQSPQHISSSFLKSFAG